MTIFENKVTIARRADEIFEFLADMNNHQQLMPADDITEWISDQDKASFVIRGMIKLTLKIENSIKNKEIKIVLVEEPPFEMTLTWGLAEKEGETEVTFTIAADLNVMMKMAVSGQLKKLTGHETNNLSLIFS
ncbi:MAG TPA: hypothetical protein VHA56_15965 [Mucilaginibacter sp.]|nr:hypothetical protein [Mucilaginibacter sp.]